MKEITIVSALTVFCLGAMDSQPLLDKSKKKPQAISDAVWDSWEYTKENLTWIDCETTGNDTARDLVLEIASVITDANLNVLAQWGPFAIYQPAAVTYPFDRFLKRPEMALDILVKASDIVESIDIKTAQASLLAFMRHNTKPTESSLCGPSLVPIDRLFLRKYMPQITAHLSATTINYGSLAQLIKLWHKNAEYKRPPAANALAEIHNSLAELNYYRTHFILPPTAVPKSGSSIDTIEFL